MPGLDSGGGCLSLYDRPLEIVQCAPEYRLLIACSWIAPERFSGMQAKEIGDCCRATVDWQLFAELVRGHDVLTTACSWLQRPTLPEPLSGALAELRTNYNSARLAASLSAAEMVRLCSRFREERIEVIPLKGGTLSQRLYGDPGMRQAEDIDLLIHPEDIERASYLLSEEGYEDLESIKEYSPAQRRHMRVIHTHLQYVNHKRRQFLELHWGVERWREDQLEELWSGRVGYQWGDAGLDVLNDTMQIIFLCDHGCKHSFLKVKWLGDMAMFVAQGYGDVCWSSVVGKASKMGLQLSLAVSALLVHWWYAIPLPAPLWNLIRREKMAPVIARHFARSLAITKKGFAFHRWIARGIFNFWTVRYLFGGRFSWRMHLRHFGINTRHFKVWPLPDRLFGLYYLLRWLDRRSP